MFTYCGNNPIMYADDCGSRYIASTTVSNEDPGDRSLACQFQNEVAREKYKVSKETSYEEDPYAEEKKALSDGWLSKYKGVTVIRVPFGGDASFSFGAIFLGNSVGTDDSAANLLRHEYGHTLQLKEMGVKNYAALVAVPSIICFQSGGKSDPNYFSYPLEYSADRLGNVNRTQKYTPDAEKNAREYWSFVALAGANLG